MIGNATADFRKLLIDDRRPTTSLSGTCRAPHPIVAKVSYRNEIRCSTGITSTTS